MDAMGTRKKYEFLDSGMKTNYMAHGRLKALKEKHEFLDSGEDHSLGAKGCHRGSKENMLNFGLWRENK